MSDHPDMPGPCRDCGCAPGETHHEGCDIARRMNCGHQEISCDCDPDDPIVNGLARDVWREEWPGSAECREFGISGNDLGGDPRFRWDRARRRWVRA